MKIKLTSKFRDILSLPNYIITGFKFLFTSLDDSQEKLTRWGIDTGEFEARRNECTDPVTGDIDKIKLWSYFVDNIPPVDSMYSSKFDCSTMILNDKLNWCISAKSDSKDSRYDCILVFYYDLMTKSFTSDSLNSNDNDLELAAMLGPFSELKRFDNEDIPNRFELSEEIKCSILTRKFNTNDITHLHRTDIYIAEPTYKPINLDDVPMKYKPTENVLNDNKIAFERAIDSFRIGTSGLIEI